MGFTEDELKLINSVPTREELEAYKSLLADAAKGNSTNFIPNSGKEHAAIMMAAMFDYTKKEFKMVVGSFSGDVSSQEIYYDSLKSALEREVTAQVILLENPNFESKVYELLKRYEANQVEILHGKKETKELISKEIKNNQIDNPAHFALFDNSAFRLELEPRKFSAIGSFNNVQTNSLLRNLFTKALNTIKHSA